MRHRCRFSLIQKSEEVKSNTAATFHFRGVVKVTLLLLFALSNISQCFTAKEQRMIYAERTA
jgi:hypothetical protein